MTGIKHRLIEAADQAPGWRKLFHDTCAHISSLEHRSHIAADHIQILETTNRNLHDHIAAQDKRIAEMETHILQKAQSDKLDKLCDSVPAIGTVIQDATSTLVWYFLAGDETKYSTTIRDLIRAKLQIGAIQLTPANAIDAERYRFIRKISCSEIFPAPDDLHASPDVFDGYIDAAMKAAK